MTARKVFSIIAIVLLVTMLVNMFIPLVGNDYVTYSLWEYLENMNDEPLRIIILIEIIIAILVCVLQICGALKDAKFAYFTVGYYFTFFLDLLFSMISNDTMGIAKIGFWLGFITSLIAIVVLIIGGFVSNEKKHRVKTYYNQSNITGYDPNTGEPIYAKPTGYDPNTGKPIY